MELQKCKEQCTRLKQKIDQLEGECTERERKINLYKEESVQKTKLVVQLQKQIATIEGSVRNQASSSGLIGALLGAASGEGVALEKIKRELAVLEEELLSKIKENEQLQINYYELNRLKEKEKQELTLLLESEVKKVEKLEKEIFRKNEESEVVRSQNDLLSRDLVEAEAKIQTIKLEMQLANRSRLVAIRARQKENENIRLHRFRSLPESFNRRTKKQEKQYAENESLLSLGDVEFWLDQWRTETIFFVEQQGTTSKAILENIRALRFLAESTIFDKYVIQSQTEYMTKLDVIFRGCKNLGRQFPFTIPFTTAFEKHLQNVDDSNNNEQWTSFLVDLSNEAQNILVTISSDDDPVTFILNGIVGISRAWNTWMMMEDDDEGEIEEVHKAVPQKEEEPANAYIDKEDDHSEPFERYIASDSISQTPDVARSSDSHPQSINLQNPQASFDDSRVVELKRHYHVQSLQTLKQLAEARAALENAEKRVTLAETRFQTLSEERTMHLKVHQECKEAMKRAREELEGTRSSYDEHLKTLSERIVELEGMVKQKDDEITQLKGEALLMSQLKRVVTSSKS
jgi:hypothetical protein